MDKAASKKSRKASVVPVSTAVGIQYIAKPKRVRWTHVLDPRTVTAVAYWDLVTTSALMYVALVTPVEVGFIAPPEAHERWTSTLFLLNRLLDLIFISDMCLQFCLAFKSEGVEGTQWITDPWRIASNYLRTWFLLDIFSVLTSIFDLIDVEGASDLTALRAVRTLRLLKLAKLARSSRVFKRWEMRMSIDYSVLTITVLLLVILLTCHWTACVWGLAASFAPLDSWAAAKEYCIPWEMYANRTMPSCPAGYECKQGSCDARAIAAALGDQSASAAGGSAACRDGFACIAAFEMYTYSLYFAIMTITSVGYGDISASAFNTGEQMLCSIIMLGSGMLW